MTSNDMDVETLPAWARKEIRTLEAQLDEVLTRSKEYRKMAGFKDDGENTGVAMSARVYGETPIPLPEHAAVTYQVGDRPVTVGYDMYGRFEVRSFGTLKISPRASNVITVEVEA
jgi:hypothetical protein